MKAWSDDPTSDSEVQTNRIPGMNNAAFAQQAHLLQSTYRKDLYLQFEIADALPTNTPVTYSSKRKDQGTKDVACEFIAHATNSGTRIKTVIVIAHRHHYERCRIVLEGLKITGLPTPDQYSNYDPLEAQPRAMSPEEVIVNDFASMAGMAKDA
jgi:diphthamide synthase subunit DPH2